MVREDQELLPIVCDHLSAPAGGLDLRAVIDGQQCLTTVQLILRGVLDVLLERGSTRVKQVRRLLENHPDVVETPEERKPPNASVS